MIHMKQDDSLAVSVVQAIQTGDIPSLKRLLDDNPGLAKATIIEKDNEDTGCKITRTLLHVVTDWPGRFPNSAETVSTLLHYGADVNARFTGAHTEAPLHWAASCDDVEVLDALLDVGADIEAPGAVIAGGTPLDDAVAFAQWNAARRLVERGAQMALWHAAALGQMEAMQAYFAGAALSERYPWGAGCSSPSEQITVAFWCACHGGQRSSAELLLDRGAELNWISDWDGLTPLDAAKRSSADDLVQWLCSQGAKSASEL